jgi:hypothetical protein
MMLGDILRQAGVAPVAPAAGEHNHHVVRNQNVAGKPGRNTP